MTNQEIKKFQSKYQKDPGGFLVDCLDVKAEHLWPKMTEVMNSVRDHRKTAVKACHSVSKSFTAGRLVPWFLYSFFPSTVITTAPSNTQVEEILWREIRDCHAKAKIPLGGKLTHTKLELGEKWFAYGFSTRPDTITQQVTRLQGFHNENVFVILDEAAGVLPEIWAAVESLLSGAGFVRFLVIGNPTCATGEFVNCFKDSSFNHITISCMDSPNYIEGRMVIPGLIGREYVEDSARKYGVESDYYKARVLGEIPDNDIDALIPMSHIEKAINRQPHPYRFKKRFLTWDVADGGDDPHMIKAWENKTEIDSQAIYGKKIEEAEPYVWRMLRKIDGNAIIVDGDGVGRVAIGLLDQAADKKVDIIQFFGSSTDVVRPEMFKHRRSEGFWALREDYRENRISTMPNAEAVEELANIRLVRQPKGLIAVEPKRDIKKRLGRSTNHADCQMMMSACFDEVKPVSRTRDRYDVEEEEEMLTPELV